MSGICGVATLPGARPPAQQEMSDLAAALEGRGPDGTRIWFAGPAALGHTLLATTPEAAVERLPLEDADTGCVITADVRLDNREELALSLGLDLRPRVIGDGELILAAYKRWGEDCPTRLLGDFAFAIWDPRNQRLFAARDQMGMKQFIYGVTGQQRLVFASRPSAVRGVSPADFPVDEARVADFLEDLEGVDHASTFFRGVLRLPPAHRLVFDAHGLRLSRYWSMDMPPELGPLSDAEYEEAFLEVFTEAVRARLRSPGPVGSMMSGGMDSGSIVAIASELLSAEGRGPLKTYSVVSPPHAACQETRAIDALMDLPGVAPVRIRRDAPDDLLDRLAEAMRSSEEPFDSTMSILRAIYGAAHDSGLRVVLDGAAGDVVFSPGDVHARMLRRGRWRAVLKDAAGTRRIWRTEPSPGRALASAAWRVAIPEPVRRLRRRFAGASGAAQPVFDGMVSDAMAGKTNLADRRRRYFDQESEDGRSANPRLSAVMSRNLTAGRERYDRLAAEQGIEPRDPFMDLRVIRTCLQMPPEQMQAQGWPKFLLRRALRGKLPDAVRWRQDKSHLGWAMTQSVLARHRNFDEEDMHALRTFGCHEARIAEVASETFRSSPSEEAARLAYLADWFRNSTNA